MQYHDQHDVCNGHFKCKADEDMICAGVEGFRGNWNGTERLRSAAMTREKEKQSGDWKGVGEDISEKNGRRGRKCG